MTIQARCIGAGFLIALMAVIGCDKGAGLDCKLTGKVTYKDAPVGGGTITFHAQDGSVAIAQIKPDGTYEMRLPEGSRTVTIETESVNPGQKKEDYRSAGGSGGMAAKYGGGGGGAKFAKNAPKGGAPMSPA